ncbi:hypothetical protein [Myxococcus sp. AB025B]|uniref:SbtR family transcriptional regulator n=1 Tax=Myxococcus sp. AB025B TaxID=2562794 RepID=UPI001142AB41|nr:hypothetical protein [Myxococcus sp. AB025B]
MGRSGECAFSAPRQSTARSTPSLSSTARVRSRARLAETGVRVRVADALARLRPGIELLLERAQKARTVRDDLRPAELIALLAAICQEALADEWSESFRKRALNLLFDGLRPTARR